MKNLSVRILELTFAAVAFSGLASVSPISADQSIVIHAGSSLTIGTKSPPPAQPDPQWASPDASAVWIRGHNEWRNSAYVWVGGYYAYPPHKNDHWVSPTYSKNEDGSCYQAGYWSK